MIKIVTDYLQETQKRFPDKYAFVSESRSVTYTELKNEMQKVSTALVRKGLFRQPVAILMDKKVECIHSMYGVVQSGNFYTVLDTSMPDARIKLILDTLQPAAILTDAAYADRAASFEGEHAVYFYEDFMKEEADEELLKKRRFNILASDVMFVLFTSGSTGVPKGVTTPHSAVISYLEWAVEYMNLDDTLIHCNQAPFYFIISTFDVFVPAVIGSTTHIVPKIMFSFPMMLLDYMKENHVNMLWMVTSVYIVAANMGVLNEIHLDELKCGCFGGEVMPTKIMNQWVREYPNVPFYNMWGATETTDWGTIFTIDREIPETESIPLGYSCGNQDIFLLNENDELCPQGEIGEICVKSPTLAYGYYNDPEKTAKVFVQNPLQKAYPEKIYRTGDLGRFDERGALVFAGRKDFQIKHMGHRIELGEIETAASSIDGVERCAALYQTEKNRIVMFYVGSISKKELKDAIKKLVPEYMVPTKINQLETMPMNLNGKIHRQELKQML